MTPQEKAKELVGKFRNHMPELTAINFPDKAKRVSQVFDKVAKQCALIAVEEIMKENEDNEVQDKIVYTVGTFLTAAQYWQQVKAEIEKL